MADPRTLDSPPGALGLYAKAAAPLIPGASLLPFVGGRGSDVPDVELRLDAVRIDPEHLAAYSRLCRLRLTGTLPATYLQVLAFPLHMALLTDRRFPFPAVGLVHVANRIVQHRPLGSGERPDLRVTATSVQPHPRGRAFTIRTEALVDGGRAWEAESTMLRRGGGGGGRARAPRPRGSAPSRS
jgi:hypothetical protein